MYYNDTTTIYIIYAVMILTIYHKIYRKIQQIGVELECLKSKHFFTSNNIFKMHNDMQCIYNDIDVLEKECVQNDKQINILFKQMDIMHEKIYNMKIKSANHDDEG